MRPSLPLWAALLAGAVGLGCPTNPGLPPCAGPAIPQTFGQRIFPVGEPAVLSVSANISGPCGDEDTENRPRRPETVAVEIYGPDNQRIPAEANLPQGGTAATIHFTPEVTGRYHAIVSFAPVGSLQQFGIYVAEDRRQEPPLARFAPGQRCSHVDRTELGTWVCDRQALREPEGAAQTLAAAAASTRTVVAGNVVWVVEEDKVHRFVDRGSGPLERTGTAAYVYARPPEKRVTQSALATEDTLLLMDGYTLLRYTTTGTGGVTLAGETNWNLLSDGSPIVFGTDNLTAVLVDAGTRYLAVFRASDPGTFQFRFRACPFQVLEAGGIERVASEPCQPLEGELVGAEENAVWTQTFVSSPTGGMNTLRRYVGGNGRLVEQGAMVLDGQLFAMARPLGPGPVLPQLATPSINARPFPSPYWDSEAGTLRLELLPEPAGAFEAPRVSPRYVWVVDGVGQGSTTVYPRESTR